MLEGKILKKSILDKLVKGHMSRQYIMIGTIHIYKSSYRRFQSRLSNISYFSDRLRQISSKFLITKEFNEDNIPHYHYILFFPKIKDSNGEYNRPPAIPTIKHCKVWQQEMNRGNFRFMNYVEDEHGNRLDVKPCYKYINTAGIHLVDAGAPQRYLQYGIIKYILYIMKYVSREESLYDRYIIKAP